MDLVLLIFSPSPSLILCYRYAREPNSTVNEDVWLCQQIMQKVGLTASQTKEDRRLRMVPASHHEAMQFSVETEMHTRPFGVHQFWFHLRPNYEMRVSVYGS